MPTDPPQTPARSSAGGPPHAAEAPAPQRFSPELRRVVLVTVLGSFMAFLDASVVNVALRTLSVSLRADLSTIQWLVTAYLLATAAVIPVSGWLAARFGARRMFLAAITVFTVASLGCGLSDSVGQLVLWRAVQGAAGLAVPVGQILLVRSSGPALISRVMGVSGIPVIMAPVLGPTVGGLLVDHAGWRWIFFLNLPIGLATVLLGAWLLPRDVPSNPGRPDLPGLLTITGGSVAVTYGLTELGARGASPAVLGVLLLGAVLLGSFVVLALVSRRPLLDLRLLAGRRYRAASVTNAVTGAVVFGAIILMPLYFQIVRHAGAVTTGLLLVPQGLGVALAMLVVARFVDRFGSGPTAVAGGLLTLAATLPFTLIGAGTPLGLLTLAMAVRGFGIGATAVPALAAAYRAVRPEQIADATVQLNLGQRLGGSIGTALLAVVLQRELTGAVTPTQKADAFGTAFWWVLGAGVLATVPAFFLVGAERRARATAPG